MYRQVSEVVAMTVEPVGDGTWRSTAWITHAAGDVFNGPTAREIKIGVFETEEAATRAIGLAWDRRLGAYVAGVIP